MRICIFSNYCLFENVSNAAIICNLINLIDVSCEKVRKYFILCITID